MNRVNLLESLSENIIVDKDKCTSCGICVDTCILDNLRLQLSPCRQACPLGVNCQGYVQLIARGEEAKALELLRESLPFPGILGRIGDRFSDINLGRMMIEDVWLNLGKYFFHLARIAHINHV